MAQDIRNRLKSDKPSRQPLGETNKQNAPVQHKARLEKVKLPTKPTRGYGADITGMTGLMQTPAKGDGYEELGKNGNVVGDNEGKFGSCVPEG
jgi:hypothetical protein